MTKTRAVASAGLDSDFKGPDSETVSRDARRGPTAGRAQGVVSVFLDCILRRPKPLF